MVSNHVSTWRVKSRSLTSTTKQKFDRIAPKHAAILTCRPGERLSEQQRILFEQVAVNCNGQIEGQINRLKAIKRQMYGRAGFHLLRAPVLPYHAMAP